MSAYYNEFDPFAAAWLRALIADGLIADGDVDERSILDVSAGDLKGYRQIHLFAGIGGWSYALRLAGWDDDREVWTGSCPCQPFSSAGKQEGTADKRHLWPTFRDLIAECRPSTIFGEQVASKLGREWLAGVRAEMEDLGYAVGAADLCAASVGAPHIRQRLWWVADADRARPTEVAGDDGKVGSVSEAECQSEHGAALSGRSRADVGLADATGRRLLKCDADERVFESYTPQRVADQRRVGHPDIKRRQGESVLVQPGPARPESSQTFWSGASHIPCADGKARRIEPGIQPLADGIPNRVGTLRGAGNAIVPQVAAVFVRAYDAA